MSWWLVLVLFYITALLIFHIYVKYLSHRQTFDSKYLPVIIEPWYFPFFGPVLSMLNLNVSLQKWRIKYGDNFTIRIFGKYLTIVRKNVDLKRYYHASEKELSMVKALEIVLGEAYPESQYIAEFTAVPYLQRIMVPHYLEHMVFNIENTLLDYFNTKNGQFWIENGNEVVVNIFDLMYRLVLRMNCANFTSKRINRSHVDEWIELYFILDAEKAVMNPISNSLKKRLGFKSKRDTAWERWIELLMPDIERYLKMIDQNIEPTDIDTLYEAVKYAKEELSKCGRPFTPRLVAFLVYSTFLPAQVNTYATMGFLLLEWICHEHDEIGQHIRRDIESAPSLGELTLQDLDSMTYIQACIYEVIRLRTYSQIFIRNAGQDILLSDGKYIAAGNLVGALWNDSEGLYTDPTKFDPQRQLPPREENKTDPYRILPFGRGKHPCTGEHYATMQIKILLICLLSMCKMELMKESSNFEAIVNKKQLAGVSRPTKPIYVRISKKDA